MRLFARLVLLLSALSMVYEALTPRPNQLDFWGALFVAVVVGIYLTDAFRGFDLGDE